MSRIDREVTISVVFRSKPGPGFGWFVNVLGRGDDILHQTQWHSTKGEALDYARVWAKENGYVAVPF